jgi:RimJ/RimL family protein N-acetyltransferase
MQYPRGVISLTSAGPTSLRFPKELEDQIAINDPEDGEEIALLAGTSFNPKVDISICRHKGGKRLGGVIYQNYTGESIAMHSASWDQHWINRDMVFVCFDYPFNQLGVKRIFGQVPEDNWHACMFNSKLGFKKVARVEGVYRHNIACIVMRMDREDCRLLGTKPRHIQSYRS